MSYHMVSRRRAFGDAATDDQGFQSLLSSLRKDTSYTGGAKTTQQPAADQTNWSQIVSGGAQLAMNIGRAATASHPSGSSSPIVDASAYSVPASMPPPGAGPPAGVPWMTVGLVAGGLVLLGGGALLVLRK